MVLSYIPVGRELNNNVTALEIASQNGHEAVVKLLLDKSRVDVNAATGSGYTPLLLAIQNRHEAVVRLLLDTGKVDTNLKDKNGRTPLSWAVQNGHEAVVRLLLDTGRVDVNAATVSVYTPLLLAAQNGNETVIRLLLNKGRVDANAATVSRYTPLLLAVQNGHEAVVRLLLNTGRVDVNAATVSGYTPLLLAAQNGNEAVVRLLLDTGKVDTNLKDKNGRTPLSWAVQNGHETVVKLLLETINLRVDASDSSRHYIQFYPTEQEHNAMTEPLLEASKADNKTTDDSVPPTDSGYASLMTSITEDAQDQWTNSDDIQTVYSESPDASVSAKEEYMSKFAEDLLAEVRTYQPNDQIMERIYQVLPALLKAFALKLGHGAQDLNHHNIMVFIHRHLCEIVEHIKEKHNSDEATSYHTQKGDEIKRLRDEKIVRWCDQSPAQDGHSLVPDQSNEDGEIPSRNDVTLLDDHSGGSQYNAASITDQTMKHLRAKHNTGKEVEGHDSEHDFAKYRRLLLQSPAYRWLITSLRREVLLVPAETNLMKSIREKIISLLPTFHSISRTRSAVAYIITYRINWNPLAFFKEQDYKEDPGDIIETAITLTGSTRDAQALACAQYLSQTWPFTGEHVMHLLKEMLRDKPGHRHTCNLPDSTRLIVWMQGLDLMVEACGTAYAVAEIGEQFAWLGAALRSSPFDLGVAYSVPRLNRFHTHSVLNETYGMNVKAHIGVHIKFTVRRDEERSANAQCQCWHDMFRNPVIVQGYPIPRRSEPNTGLELPLNLMAGLVHTQRVTFFDGKLYIKGQTSMLVPTRRNEDLLLWHFLRHKNGEAILYRHNSGPHVDNIDFSHLDKMRHIVGWCSQAKTIAGKHIGCRTSPDMRLITNLQGAAEAIYLVKESELPGPYADCALKDAVIRKQQRITSGHSISFGSKDGTRESQTEMLEFISEKHVILWDEDDKRGWMMNGTTALLHLLRASLERNRTGKIRSKCLFKPEQLQEAETRYESGSALEALLNSENQSLSIFEDEDVRVKDRIEDLVYILGQMIEYEETKFSKRSKAREPMNEARERLEGWDFIDVATRKYPVRPRLGALQTVGRSWTELSRSLDAITIFGRGYGELIQPVDPCNLCTHWARLPTNKYYLAALISDFKEIIKTVQNRLRSPRMLFDDILWHHSDKSVDVCPCSGDSSIKHADIIPILKPQSPGQECDGIYWIDSKEPGAVMFGNCKSHTYRANPPNDTKSILPPACSASQDQSFSPDFGLGSSGVRFAIRPDPTPSHPAPKRRRCPQVADVRSPEPIAEAINILNNSTHKLNPPHRPEHYYGFRVAILCALKIEADAVQAFFDGRWDNYEQPEGDDNAYSTGWIGSHAVVLVHLAGMGTLKASSAAKDLKRTCPYIKLGLVVGICGGIPFYGNDCPKEILLGDVIVSTSLIQHDFGHQHDTDFIRKRKRHEELSRSTDAIQAFLNKISTLVGQRRLSERTTNYVLESGRGSNAIRFRYPGLERDKLYKTGYRHIHHRPAECKSGECAVGEATKAIYCKSASKKSCMELGCDDEWLVLRQRLEKAKQDARQSVHPEHPTHTSSESWIHFGHIASGDIVMKSGKRRDKIASDEEKEGEEILGFEMEGAGVWETVPTIVVKGVCDYSDSHKNDAWHGYAASTAAACMKALLHEWPIFARRPDFELLQRP